MKLSIAQYLMSSKWPNKYILKGTKLIEPYFISFRNKSKFKASIQQIICQKEPATNKNISQLKQLWLSHGANKSNLVCLFIEFQGYKCHKYEISKEQQLLLKLVTILIPLVENHLVTLLLLLQ